MAFDEPVEPEKFKDFSLLDSAVNRAYQTWAGVDLYDSIYKKAAALFHSLTCNHCFYNGNKRTAVMAVDSFLTANEVFLLLSNEDMYELAKNTASANESGVTPNDILVAISAALETKSATLDAMRRLNRSEYPNAESLIPRLEKWRDRVRNHHLNTP
jgi:death-on-curing family protein